MAKTLEELRNSSYHQQLGRKMYASFVALQQGIALSTAFKKIPEPVGDLWLMIVEFAERRLGKPWMLASQATRMRDARD